MLNQIQKGNIFEVVNQNVFNNIMEYLNIVDITQLMKSSRKLYYLSKGNYSCYFKYIYNHYIKDSIISNYCFEYFDDSTFIKYHSTLVQQLYLNQKNSIWKSLYFKFNQIQKLCPHLTNTFSLLHILANFHYHHPPLKRENIGLYCATNYQSLLAQKLEQEQKGCNHFQDIDNTNFELIKTLKQQSQQSQDQLLENHQAYKSMFLKLRWYIIDDELDYFVNYSLKCAPLLIQVMIYVSQIISLQVQTIQTYLTDIILQRQNSFDLLSEYCFLWTSYSNSIIELENNCQPLLKLINESYAQIFPNYPSYPQYSIWRLMAKEWNKWILMNQNIRPNLIQSYLDIILKRRINVLNFIFQNDNTLDPLIEEEGYIQPIYEYISHDVLDNYFHSFNNELIEDPEYFIQKEYYQDILLTNAFQCFQDISLNDINIHWQGYSDQSYYEGLLSDVLDNLVQDTRSFYNSKIGIFKGKLQYLMKYFDQDLKYMERIGNEELKYQLKEVQKRYIDRIIEDGIDENIDECLKEDEEYVQNILKKEYQPIIQLDKDQQLILQRLEKQFEKNGFQVMEGSGLSTHDEDQMKLVNIPLELIDVINKKLTHKQRLEIECYQEWIEEMKIFQKQIEIKDNLIRELNREREIPQNLPQQFKNYYNVEGQLRVEQLEQLEQMGQMEEECEQLEQIENIQSLSEYISEEELDLDQFS